MGNSVNATVRLTLDTRSSLAATRRVAGGQCFKRCLLPIILLGTLAIGCKAVAPSNHRDWTPDQALLSYAEFAGDQVHVHNIRNCNYLNEDEYIVEHYNRTIDLKQVESVDFLVVPFPDMPNLAHTMLSFGLGNGDYLALSVEIRKERDEAYAAWKGSLRQYELMYVLGDERDLIKLRTNHRQDDVYLYRGQATSEQTRALLVDVLKRANKLRDKPEFYDTLTNNCTTNLVRHVNHLRPHRVPYSYQVLLPGHSDRLAHRLGLLDTDLPFEELKIRSRINTLAMRYSDADDFSDKIRMGLGRY